MQTSVSFDFDNPPQKRGSGSGCADDFIEQMNCLYLLSFLVTADRRIAEKCFSESLDEYIDSCGGFTDWARQEGRRAVLRHAVQIIQPIPKQSYTWSIVDLAPPTVLAVNQPFAAITSLSAFERFVFVMSVLEGLSDEECAALLNCTLHDVGIGRELARTIIAAEDISCDSTMETHPYFISTLLGHQRCGIC